MNKPLGVKLYSQIFENHIKSFLSRQNLFQGKDRVLLAVSGGVDSMVLAQIALKFKLLGLLKEVRVLFINHSTREEQELEGQLVESFCREHGLIYISKKIESSYWVKSGNFEFRARKKREEFYLDALEQKEYLWLGHHLNDSFEWSLMTSFKSSSLSPRLGIALLSRRKIRPLLCVTKEQIYKYANSQGIEYREDPTNESAQFERNHLRQWVNKEISLKYPKYLYHYAHAQNHLVQKLGISLLKSKGVQLHETAYSSVIFTMGSKTQGLRGCEYLVVEQIQRLSKQGRSSIIRQVKRLIEMSQGGQEGPLSLAQDLWGFAYPGQIVLIRNDLSFKAEWNKKKIYKAEPLPFLGSDTIFIGISSKKGAKRKIAQYINGLSCENYRLYPLSKARMMIEKMRQRKGSNMDISLVKLTLCNG